eukprot:8423380-Pyramimonas_sp.AAC.1
MWTPPLGPSAQLPMGPRNAALGEGDARELRHWDLDWSSLWGHEALSCVCLLYTSPSPRDRSLS